jgi:hypothetical protein
MAKIMKSKSIFALVMMLFMMKSFSQNTVNEIETKSGVHYIRTNINYPIAGTYLFNEGEPIVELNENGTGFYQLHDQPKRPINWGIECEKTGESVYKKGFNSAAYILWYRFLTTYELDTNLDWNSVAFTIHFNTLKMFIQGERVKSYKESETKSKE